MELFQNSEKVAKYLASYLSGEEKLVKSHYSNYWVFPGRWEYCGWCHKEFQKWPYPEMLRAYHKMTERQLEADTLYGLYLEDKVKSCKIKEARIGSKHKKRSLVERVLKPNDYEILS